jgi:broad specificity phosphatase PhoE
VLVRHGQSKGNVDETEYSRTPDWKVELTAKGKEQARTAGKALAELLAQDAKIGKPSPVFVYCSPYRRCQQTLDGLLEGAGLNRATLLGDREEPRLREQEFGNFQNPEHTEVYKEQRAKFGRFFYRFPDGESGADVYDRVSTWLESLYREFLYGSITRDTTVVLVTHGLTARLFLMRWYHWPVELFEQTTNPGNAQLMVMERDLDEPDSTYYHLAPATMEAIGVPHERRASMASSRRQTLKHSDSHSEQQLLEKVMSDSECGVSTKPAYDSKGSS